MIKQITITLTAVMYFITTFAQSQIDCNQNSDVIAVNQQIRETTYQYIRLVNDSKYKVDQKTITKLATDYIAIQTKFNAIFTAMKADKNIFVSKRKICERYSDKLTTLIIQAQAYDSTIISIIEPTTKQNQFGVSDVLDIIDWIWKKASAPVTFYDQLNWKDWQDILTPADNQKKTDSTKSGKN